MTAIAGANSPEVRPRIDPGVVPVAPFYPNRVVPNRFHGKHFQAWLEHLKWVGGGRGSFGPGRGAMRPGAAGTGAPVTMVDNIEGTVVPTLPVDDDAL